MLVFMLPVWVGGAAWWFRDSMVAKFRSLADGIEVRLPTRPRPDPAKYATLKRDLERWRKELAARHGKANNPAERQAVEADARIILERALPAMMRCWLGTGYDFDGTAQGPGEGKIACGYFVATVLRDAGFKVDRYKLARQPSENILRSFLPGKACHLTVGQDYQKFTGEMERREPGVYLVGLDTHVGFLVVTGGGFRLLHASGSSPWCVVDEGPDEAGVLLRSSWRMVGNLTQDAPVIRRWLTADRITVRGT